MGLLETLGLPPLKSIPVPPARRGVSENTFKGALEVATEDAGGAAGPDFKPMLEIAEHPNPMQSPVIVPKGEEVGVELRISNWDFAPKGASAKWRYQVVGAAIKVSIDPSDGNALLSFQGGEPSTGLVRSFVDITINGRVAAFEFPPLFVTVTSDGNFNPADRSEDRGGPANVTDLEQDMGILMGPWLTAAVSGVDQFAANALSDEIDDLSSGSMQGFFQGILGNTMWAATVFFPQAGALKIFVVSMAGIAAAAVPSVPHASKSHIPEVAAAMKAYLFDIFGKLTAKFRTTAQAIVATHPDIRRFEALTLFAKASLQPAAVQIDASFKQKPKLNLKYISDQMESKATEELKSWVARQKAAKDKKDYEEMVRKTSRRQPGEM